MAVFEDLVKKADKRAKSVPDYKIELEGEVYSIPYSDSLQMLEISNLVVGQILAQLSIIFFNYATALNDHVHFLDGAVAAVLHDIVENNFDHSNHNDANAGKSEKQEKSEK